MKPESLGCSKRITIKNFGQTLSAYLHFGDNTNVYTFIHVDNRLKPFDLRYPQNCISPFFVILLKEPLIVLYTIFHLYPSY